MGPDSHKHLLLIEGTADTDEVEALSDAGFSVETVASAAEVIEKSATERDLQVLADANTISAMLQLGTDECRKQLEPIRESESMYRSFIERSGDGIVVLQDRLIKFVNPRFLEISGYTAETLLGAEFLNYLTPEEMRWALKRYEQRIAGEQLPTAYATVMTRSDGTKIALEVSGALISFEGRPADLVLVRDISERQKAEEYLEKYRLLSENARDMILFIAPDGRIIDANRSAVEAYGYTRDELLTKSIRDLRADPDSGFIPSVVQAQRETIRLENVHRRKDGSEFWGDVTVSGAVIGGEPVLLGIVRDITENKRIAAAVDEERRRLRAVLDALPVAVVIVDEKGAFVEINDQTNEMWGGSIPQVANLRDYDQFKAHDFDTGQPINMRDSGLYRALTKGETTFGQIIAIETSDGRQATILHSAAPIIDSEGRITGAIAAQQDITELVELRNALQKSLEETKRESWRARALESIAEAGLSTLRLPELLQTLVERIAKVLDVDACCVFVLDEDAGEFEAHAEYNVPGLIGCRIKMDEGLIGKVAVERQPIYVPDADRNPLATDSCRVRRVAKALLGVPLIARDRVVGVTRVQSVVDRVFTEEEVNLLQQIADRVALAIDNARLFNSLQRSRNEVEENLEHERKFSLLLQRALLPTQPLIREDYKLAFRYVPAYAGREIGGDFYDVFRLGDRYATVMIGDVSGKGLEAASIAATTRSTIHAFAHETQSPGEALARANLVLYGQQPEIESFVTIFLVILDLWTGQIHYSSAGHPPAIILRADGSVEFLRVINLPIGVTGQTNYIQSDDTLGIGDKLILYTDGISEAHGVSGMLDLEGIEERLVGHSDWTPDEIADMLISAATEWADGKLRDDAAIVVVERTAGIRTITSQ